MKANVLVTGGGGFIGSHLVDALLSKGYNIRVLDALVSQVHGPEADWPVWVPRGVEKIRGDVSDISVWENALAGIDVVYHLAAEVGVGQSMYEPAAYTRVNSLGTAKLMEKIASPGSKVEKVVVASSMSLYGEGKYACSECGPTHPAPRTPIHSIGKASPSITTQASPTTGTVGVALTVGDTATFSNCRRQCLACNL